MRLLLPANGLRQDSSNRPLIAKWLPRQAWGIGLATVVSFTAASLLHDRLFHTAGPSAGAADSAKAESTAKPSGPDPTTTVVLAEGKFAQADIKLGAAQTGEVAKEVAVTGRIEADPNRRFDVRPKAPGVVRTVPVQPGTKVRAGDVLVILDSAEVGSARLLVRERQRALATARAEAAWKEAVASNAEAIITQLRKGASAQTIAKEFADKLVGTVRGTLITAWAELEMASHEFEKQSDLNKRQIVGEHPVFLAEHTLEGAQAKFNAALEQVRFDVSQQNRVARQMVRDAEEMVLDAASRLRILGVAADDNNLVAHPEAASNLPDETTDIAGYPIVAPADGTVITTSVTRTRRVEVGDPLFVVADLSRVYAVANIPESDFAALPGLNGGTVHLTAEAFPGRTFDTKMLYTGAEVDPITRTVRLVAEADNRDDLLKLGMFARIALDTKTVEKATVVPPSAVVDFDGVAAVFMPDAKQPRTFTKHRVKLGRSTPDGQIILGGIKPGDPVVISGTFLLKSELILQNDTGEE